MTDRPQKAEDLFKQGYNCCQAVIGAYADELELDNETALKLASSFGGGMGRLREVCGAVTAMFMIAGIKYDGDILDTKVKEEHYKLVQSLAKKFKEQNGLIICRELLKLMADEKAQAPELRTETYYKVRPCIKLVKSAAEITDEFLKQKTENT